MVQDGTISSSADLAMSADARHQFQDYLARASASTSAAPPSGSSSVATAPSDLDVLVRRSASLTTSVDTLHAHISNEDSSNCVGDPQLFWSTVTLLTNLRELSTQLQRVSSAKSDKEANGELVRTRQNVAIVESLLCMLSVSNTGRASDAFTAPIGSQSRSIAPSTGTIQSTNGVPERRGYEYWKQQTLSALNSDDIDAYSSTSSLDEAHEGLVSDTDSILTDPEIHLAPTKPSSTPLAGINPVQDEDDLSEYDRALHAQPQPSPSAPTPTTSATPGASETILQSDRATHDALSSELLRMASILKSNSLAFADSLERDRLLLEKAGTDLGQNLDLMTRTRGRLGVYSKKARSMGWFTLSAILVVIISWMLMFLLIRLT